MTDQMDAALVADHISIAALVHRYALFVRRGQGAACGDLFAVDATYEIREVDATSAANLPVRRTLLEGRDAIAAYIGGSAGGPVRVVPLLHNLLINIDGDTAIGTSMLESRTWPGEGFIGEYEDQLQKTDGTWLFAARTFTLFLGASPPPAA